MDQLIDFANVIIDAMNNSMNSFDSFFDRALLWIIISYFQIKLEAFKFAAHLAEGVIQNIGLSNTINAAWSSIDSRIVAVLNYCRVPDALNLILTAYVTRFILALVPF